MTRGPGRGGRDGRRRCGQGGVTPPWFADRRTVRRARRQGNVFQWLFIIIIIVVVVVNAIMVLLMIIHFMFRFSLVHDANLNIGTASGWSGCCSCHALLVGRESERRIENVPCLCVALVSWPGLAWPGPASRVGLPSLVSVLSASASTVTAPEYSKYPRRAVAPAGSAGSHEVGGSSSWSTARWIHRDPECAP